jgi:hypothetical protein
MLKKNREDRKKMKDFLTSEKNIKSTRITRLF